MARWIEMYRERTCDDFGSGLRISLEDGIQASKDESAFAVSRIC
jgi:hypothetical protein